MSAKNTLDPIRPGEVLREDFLEPLGISINQLSRDLSVPPNRVSEIVNGKRSITADTALRLQRYFGVEAQFWLNLQTEYWRHGMAILAIEIAVPDAVDVRVSEDTLSVDLTDGRTISVPLGWHPRLEHATPKERTNWRFIGKGQGIHWEDIDEEVSIEGLLAGKPSGESQTSFKRWLQDRQSRPTSA